MIHKLYLIENWFMQSSKIDIEMAGFQVFIYIFKTMILT